MLLSLAIVAWEYLLNAAMNRAGDWNPAGVIAHMTLDFVLLVAVVALALMAGLRLARRFRMSTREWAGPMAFLEAGLWHIVRVTEP